MTRKMNVVIIHGIGWGDDRDHYADELRDNIATHFEHAITDLALDDLPDHASEEALRFAPVYWSPVTQTPQDNLIALLGLLGTGPRPLRKVQLEIQRQMIGLLGDIIAYGDTKVYQAIQAEIDKAVTSLSEACVDEYDPDGYANLTMVGHSLGSVIASDYIYDRRDRDQDRRWVLPDYHLKMKNIFLLGSPMAMYTLRGNPNATLEQIRASLERPIQVDPDNGLWLNMYDPQDPVGLPLTPIESYQNEGVIDCEVAVGTWLTGWNAASHVGYWRNDHVARMIGHKLALDWAALNSPTFDDIYYSEEVTAFRATICDD